MFAYKLIIWDIDGTLLDTHEGVSAALGYTLEQFGILKSAKDILSMVHTPKIKDAFIKIAKMDEYTAKQATDVFRDYYLENTLLQASPYPKILDILQVCHSKEIMQAIVTNKRQDCATKICAHFGIDKFCIPIYGGNRYNTLSKADLIKKCLETFKIQNTASVVMIGDTDSDKIAAQEAGIDFLGVNYGFGFQNIQGYANSSQEILDKLGVSNGCRSQ